MKLKSIFAASLITLGLTACGKSEPVPAPTHAPIQNEGMDHNQMNDNCDMQGMDMSKMSAEEHRAMMEGCQPSGSKGDGHTEHSHGGQP